MFEESTQVIYICKPLNHAPGSILALIRIIHTSASSPIMRPFSSSQTPFLLSLTIHSISAQLDLGTQLAYPPEFDINPVLASTAGFIPKENYATNTDNNECQSLNSQHRMRARAYDSDDPSSVLCPVEPGAAASPQYNFKQPLEPAQQQFDGTKNDPNNPDPNQRPEKQNLKWWERLLIPLQDLVRPEWDERNDGRKAPSMSSILCPDPNKQVAVCSAAIPYLSGPGELVIEYCRFSAFFFFFSLMHSLTPIEMFFLRICLQVHTTRLLEKTVQQLTTGNGAL